MTPERGSGKTQQRSYGMKTKTNRPACNGCYYAQWIQSEDDNGDMVEDWICCNDKALQYNESIMYFNGCINRSDK